MGDHGNSGRTQGIPLRVLSSPEVLQYRLHHRASPETYVLHHERHSAWHSDVSRSAVDLLLCPVTEGTHRSGRSSLLPPFPRQRCRHDSEDIGPRAFTRYHLTM